jgi:hypothetical protein
MSKAASRTRTQNARDRAETFFQAPTPDERNAAMRDYKAEQDAVREKMAAQRAARLAREAPTPRSK